MDLETENRIAAILLKEAAELRRQAQQEGVLAYLKKPTVRGRPNSRFLTATVRGIQQANRAVEVNEMWRVRQKELELDERLKGRSRDEDNHVREGDRDSSRSRSRKHDIDASCSSSKRSYEDHHSSDDEGLKDEEIEKFLHSRVKRGRGSVGSRMDETGPYLRQSSESQDEEEKGHCRAVLGPQKPPSLKRYDSSGESSDESSDEDERRRSKKNRGSKWKQSKKHSPKEKSRDRRKKKKEKRHKRKH